MKSSTLGLDLGAVLLGYREEIAAGWVRLLFQIGGAGGEGPAYSRLAPVALTANCREGVAAAANYFKRDSYTAMEQYVDAVCTERVLAGFGVAEVIEAFLALKQAAQPVVWREAQWERTIALAAMADLDDLLNWAVIRVSNRYARQLNALLAAQVSELEQQQRELERRVREISALNQTAALLNSSLDLRQVLDLILESLRQVVSYDSARILLVEENEGEKLRVVAAQGDAEQTIGDVIPIKPESVFQTLSSKDVPYVITEVGGEDSAIGKDCYWLGLNLVVKAERIGLLILYCLKSGDPFTERDGETLHAFANQAATAIANARLYARSSALASLEERNRLSRELHDSASQSLFSLVLQATAANTLLEQKRYADTHSKLTTLQETASAALQEMRSVIFQLRPARLEDAGLATALQQHVQEVSTRNAIEVSYCGEAVPRLPLETENALFRIGQEAVANVVKHSRANHLWVSLYCDEGHLVLEVVDNGIGISSAQAQEDEQQGSHRRSLGMTSMRERAALLGGSIWIGPRDEGGTRIEVRVPLATTAIDPA